MSKKRLGVGFIGSGFISQFHIRSWINIRNADVNGVIAKPVESAGDAAALVKKLAVGEGKIFSSITDMVADPDIDALWICSPNYNRIEVMEE
ncbi:Gfo/Idh/MocA family oxidoreductase, partial [candidate division KSB1 bacterium]|nr:Gfo/Idh/MocA family oxidoreductase [candidate division KSB1 bacterium]